MKIKYCLLVMLFAWTMLFVSCGSAEESQHPLPTLAPTNEPTATVALMKSPTPTDIPTQSPVPTREVPERQPVDRSTPVPTVTSVSAPTSTCTPAPTSTPIPEDYGDDIFVFEREYTDEWAWIEVCFWIKDKDGNPLPDKWCELLVDQDYVMIKSPLVVDYYDTRQDAVTDEEGKVKFILLEQREDGDRELNLTIKTLNSRHTEKIYCVDPVRTVPAKPAVTVEQKKEYIELRWERDHDAKKYYVERKVNDGEYELVQKWYPSHNEYIDYDVKAGNTYHYRVYGENHMGVGEVCEVNAVFRTSNTKEDSSNSAEVKKFDLLEVTQKAEEYYEQVKQGKNRYEAALKTMVFLGETEGMEEVWFSDDGTLLCFEAEGGVRGKILLD